MSPKYIFISISENSTKIASYSKKWGYLAEENKTKSILSTEITNIQAHMKLVSLHTDLLG